MSTSSMSTSAATVRPGPAPASGDMSAAARARSAAELDAAARAAVVRARRVRDARQVGVILTLAALCFCVLCVSLSLGEVKIPVLDVVRTLFGADEGGDGYIVTSIRLPRALTGVLAGAAFGMSGAIFQALLRNPLASPDVIGITDGASAAAVIAIVGFGLGGYPVSVVAFVGALVTATIMYLLAWRRGVTGYRLVLIGIAVGAMLSSVISYVMTISKVYEARQALGWLTGSLNAKSWDTVRPLGLALAVLVPLVLLSGRRLAVLRAGDDVARALGVTVERSRLALLLLGVALTAVATAAVGPVAFVAFTSGPIARRLVVDGEAAILPAALVGALVMTTSDLIGQHAIPSIDFPVGVVTAIIGAPYLLWLLAATNRTGRGG
ncbi:iron chelate uptake ABC transporter family permease subunit [Pseudofrankia sp. BMG5.37]|uniref:FecCD family ABC transporter permease n=1 Tax=Pseudofrankia sp. BMG5.37 TaxID=3050035 RepID=UPI0028942115|nr:iron chelate uptake ABC transporter family permease subunit [Pseudofrankia sp. BMG5.37]MDT3439484.1 iron chelate uptake ABC transporter family permease subunit [Pseudofrankia sp. BMG5.37]